MSCTKKLVKLPLARPALPREDQQRECPRPVVEFVERAAGIEPDADTAQ